MKPFYWLFSIVLLAGCCPQYDCAGPDPYLHLQYTTSGITGSYSSEEIDTTILYTYYKNSVTPVKDTWYYHDKLYFNRYKTDSSGSEDIFFHPFSWDSIVMQNNSGHKYIISGYKEMHEYEKTEFGCKGCPFITIKKININNREYNCLKQLQSSESEVDVYDGILHLKNL